MASNSIDNAGDCAEARRRGRDPSRGRWAVLALGLLLAGCLVPAPEEPAPVTPPSFVMVDPNEVDPRPTGIASVNRAEAGILFSLGKVKYFGVAGPLRYFWYYDYEPSASGPDQFAICASLDETCLLRVCSRPKAQEDKHHLLVIVANAKQNQPAKHPFDFPAGTLFDSVQWTLTLTGTCPVEVNP